jgi:hypothetical protein
MKYVIGLLVAIPSLLVAFGGLPARGFPSLSQPTVDVQALELASAPQDQDKPLPGLTSNQALMRDKLKHMNQILDGLTMENFEQTAESALTLAMISRATSWHIAEPTAKYQRLSKNFQEQARDLERHAREKNIEAATLDLVRMNISCTHCHQHMREHLGISK